MNLYTCSDAELKDQLMSDISGVLTVCCAPSRVDPVTDNMVPARPGVLSQDEIIKASRLDPRAGLGAARHELPDEVVVELAYKDPWAGLYFVSDRLSKTQRSELEAALLKEAEDRATISESKSKLAVG